MTNTDIDRMTWGEYCGLSVAEQKAEMNAHIEQMIAATANMAVLLACDDHAKDALQEQQDIGEKPL